MRTLIIDALCNKESRSAARELKKKNPDTDTIETAGMKISPCVGCGSCWLKTPGVCSIHDDYEEILKSILKHDKIVLIGGTALGFIDYRLKNIVDRILPIVTMMVYIVDGQERHVPRYDKRFQIALLYDGDGEKEYLNRWMERFALNFNSKSLGAYPLNKYEEAAI